jgi:serine/threonine-protein kinase
MSEPSAVDPLRTPAALPPLEAATDTTAPAAAHGALANSSGQAARYRALRLHARGGLGEVLLARDEELQRDVALKRIQEIHAHDGESQRRFLLEAEITGRLEHPGIVPVYGLVEGDDGRPCYAMRFIEGESLRDAIERFHSEKGDPRERRLALRRLLVRFVAVCNTVAYAHSRGILHRDLKPANIMLGKFGESLVVDWGLAKKFTRSDADRCAGEQSLTPSTRTPVEGGTQMGQAAGTPAYMSPEQAAGHWDAVGPPSDIYNLGATLYHLLTGRAPVDGGDVGAILACVQRGEWPPPRSVNRDVPRALEAVCVKAMALRPRDRYASALDLAADLERWLAGEAVSAWREPWTVRLRRWSGRRRTLVAGVASALVVALLCMAVAMTFLIRANRRADTARQQAETNERLAAAKRDEALASLRAACELVDRFSTRVNNDPRLQEKDLEELRKKLLQSAIEAYRTLADVHSDDPDVRARLAWVYMQLGLLTFQMGDRARSGALYKQAAELLDPLLKAYPDRLDFRRQQGKNHNHRGVAHAENQEPAEAEKWYRAALKIQEPLARRADALYPDHYELARTRLNLAVLESRRSNLTRAEALLLQAQQAWSKLAKAKANRNDLECQKELGTCALNLGAVYLRGNQRTKARTALERARKIYEAVLSADRTDPMLRSALARTHVNLAALYMGTARALFHYRKARQLQEELARRSPGVGVHQERLADTCRLLGGLQASAGDLRSAEATFLQMLDAAVRLVELYPRAAKYQHLRADAHQALGITYQMAGRFAEAETAYLGAQKIWRHLADRPGATPADRYHLGWSYNYLGILYRHMRRKPDAERQHRLAMKVRQALVDSPEANPNYRANLASTCTNLANLSPGPVPFAEAETLFKKSIEIQKVLVKVQPEFDQHTLDYAMSYNNLGVLYWNNGRVKEAEAPWLEALRIREELLKRRPGKPGGLAGLVMSHASLGTLYQRRKDFNRAEKSYRAAVRAGKELLEAQPVVQNAIDLAKTYYDLGSLCQDQDKSEPAIAWYKRALEELGPWGRRDLQRLPPAGRNTLRSAHLGLAVALSDRGRFREALPHWNRAVELAGPGSRNTIRADRAITLAQGGAYQQAVDEAIELSGLPGTRPAALFHLAGVHALSSAAAAKDARLTQPRRKDLADLYARRALALLAEVHKAGLFKSPKHRQALKESKHFAALRDREEFKKLLATLEAR